jgi:hypothetical protein
VLSVRIVSHDYYMAQPYPDLDFSFSSFHGSLSLSLSLRHSLNCSF